MTDEQQLRERAEAILKKHGLPQSAVHRSEGTFTTIDAMIDFLKQELSGIGEVVYVPVSEVTEEALCWFHDRKEQWTPKTFVKKLTLSGEESSMEQRP